MADRASQDSIATENLTEDQLKTREEEQLKKLESVSPPDERAAVGRHAVPSSAGLLTTGQTVARLTSTSTTTFAFTTSAL